jgi:hypothetical protein
MPTRVQIHPTAKTAGIAVVCAVAVVLAILGLKRWLREEPAAAPIAPSTNVTAPAYTAAPLLPLVALKLDNPTLEKDWSGALSVQLNGTAEAPTEAGRVDVLTDRYAIEVDRLDKWHEAIGQAAHYAQTTKRIPVVALIIPSDSWPLSDSTIAKLLLIEETCVARGIRLVLLRQVGA